MSKRVYIAYTGGTIGMRASAEGYTPEPGYFEPFLRKLPELTLPGMPHFEIYEYPELLDSANMVPENWNIIAADIARNYQHFDGFVVLHGTDTMAHTAAALSFMLEGLTKPVILTGSQIPLCEIRNDARDNLTTSLLIAGMGTIPEVCLYFDGKLLRGNRTVKVSAGSFDAFDSPNHPPLGRAGIDIVIDWHQVLKPVRVPMRARECGRRAAVAAIRLFPGISAEVLANVLQPPLKGLILECYGAGNAPHQDEPFLAVITEATRRGVVVVAVTQCLRGTVNLGSYATGSALARAGVIGGFDMTVEAALAKLLYLLELGLDPDQTKAEMQRNLRGEMTRPTQNGEDEP